MTTPKLRLSLSLAESNALKGIALLLLLCHHLFYIQNGNYDDIYIGGYSTGIVQLFGLFCKVCVPIFVFLSGYGLMASAEKSDSLNFREYISRRFFKLFPNYWFIFVIFIPVGLIFFDYSLEKVYGDNLLPYMIIDVLGLACIFETPTFNPTWWFYSCIILLYLIFPSILVLQRRKLWMHLMFWGSVVFVLFDNPLINPIKYYLITFLLGVYSCNGLIYRVLPPPSARNRSFA